MTGNEPAVSPDVASSGGAEGAPPPPALYLGEGPSALAPAFEDTQPVPRRPESARLSTERIPEKFVEAVCARLAAGERVRRSLPGGGRIHIDRQLPFLCVYRRPTAGAGGEEADRGTRRFVTSEAAYLILEGAAKPRSDQRRLLESVTATLAAEFGAFLIVEVWAGAAGADEAGADEANRPHFVVNAPRGEALDSVVASFEQALGGVTANRQQATVRVERGAKRIGPAHLPGLLTSAKALELGCTVLGIEVRPVYRHPETDELYPLLMRTLVRTFARALHRSFFDFTRTRTTHRPKHFHTLGRRAMVKAVWEVDRQLAEVSSQFDFLLQVSPINATQAWADFRRNHCEQAPKLLYRPLPVDPSLLKRALYAVPIERVEDPTIANLFRQKQEELDRQITMLGDMNTVRFIHGGTQLYGEVEDDLEQLSRQILYRLPSRTREGAGGMLDAEALSARALAEIEHYRGCWPQVVAKVEIRDDLAGLMVSRGSVLVGRQTSVSAARADALIHHEVGTHVLTYENGRAQPFRQLCGGLNGYEPLQEGLAVLAEFLVGGLSRARLRLLAARVMASRHMLDGASFVETFRELDRTYDFQRKAAFNATVRIYRGGGLVKDAIYLRGLRDLLSYLGDGGELEPLLMGKIALAHVPIIRELKWRGVLQDPPLRPRYLDDPAAIARLEAISGGLTVLDMVERKSL